MWQRLDTLDPTAPIPVLRRSDYREYQRTGQRGAWESLATVREARLRAASLALWLNHPQADRDHVQDLLWAWTEDWTWVMPAHEPVAIDLGAAMGACLASQTVFLHRNQLEPDVVERVTQVIDDRIWRPLCDPNVPLWWRTVGTNWNLVCWGDCLRSALHLIDDPVRLADITHHAVHGLAHGLDGFTADGGCVEGTDYWNYGFGHFARAALALYHRSGRRINLLDSDHCRAIARFPLAASLRGPIRPLFGDSRRGYLCGETVLAIEALAPTPGLLAFCPPDKHGRLQCRSPLELALANDRPLPKPPARHDAFLPDLGLAKIQGRPGPRQMTLFCVGGTNGVPHNHNDLGSFVLFLGERDLLTDPGGPRYCRDTFGPRRYENVYCGAAGHSVPVINGIHQAAGSRYRAAIQVEGVGAADAKRVGIDLSHAYPTRAGIRHYERTFRLNCRRNQVTLTETFAFRRRPRSVVCQFITLDPVRAHRNGSGIRIGSRGSTVDLTTTTDGRFQVDVLDEDAVGNGKDRPIHRIRFYPRQLMQTMELVFTIVSPTR